MGSILLFSGELPDNSDRAEWAKNALAVFCDETGLDLEFENQEAVGDLMTNLGHYCDRYGLDFLSIVSGAVGLWDVEKREEENGEPNAMYPQKRVVIELINPT